MEPSSQQPGQSGAQNPVPTPLSLSAATPPLQVQAPQTQALPSAAPVAQISAPQITPSKPAAAPAAVPTAAPAPQPIPSLSKLTPIQTTPLPEKKSGMMKFALAGVGVFAIGALMYAGKTLFLKGTVPPSGTETELAASAPETKETNDSESFDVPAGNEAAAQAQAEADEALSQAGVAESAATEAASYLVSVQGKNEEIRVLLVTLDTERAEQTLQTMETDAAGERIAAQRAADAVTQIQTAVENLTAQAQADTSLASILENAKASLAKAEQARDQAAASSSETDKILDEATQAIQDVKNEIGGSNAAVKPAAEEVATTEEGATTENAAETNATPATEETPESPVAEAPTAEENAAVIAPTTEESPIVTAPAEPETPASASREETKLHGSYIQGETGPVALLYPLLLAGANGAYWVMRKKRKA